MTDVGGEERIIWRNKHPLAMIVIVTFTLMLIITTEVGLDVAIVIYVIRWLDVPPNQINNDIALLLAGVILVIEGYFALTIVKKVFGLRLDEEPETKVRSSGLW